MKIRNPALLEVAEGTDSIVLRETLVIGLRVIGSLSLSFVSRCGRGISLAVQIGRKSSVAMVVWGSRRGAKAKPTPHRRTGIALASVGAGG